MKVLVTAMHVKNTLFGKKVNVPVADLNETHVVIGHWVKDIPVTEEIDSLMMGVYRHFNWMEEKDGYAGELVNEICRLENTHASMSVGDVVKVQYRTGQGMHGDITKTRWFMIEPIGYRELEDE